MKKVLTTISIGGLLAVSSIAIAQQAPDTAQQAPDIAQQAPDSPDRSNRLEARLQPVISVDASGQARLDSDVGVATTASPLKWRSPGSISLTWGSPLEMASAMKSSSCASFVAAC